MNNMPPQMPNMGPMAGGPVGGPMAMMNNGAAPPQMGQPRSGQLDHRAALNTYIYEYFLRNNLYDCARLLLKSDASVAVKGDKNRVNGLGDDPMDTDSKTDIGSDDLPPPNLPLIYPESSFLAEWFAMFWEFSTATKSNGEVGPLVRQYVNHAQQNRIKQNHQQEMLRQIRPDQVTMMNNIKNATYLKQNNLARTAMANNGNPGLMMMNAKQNQLQRDPSNMDGQPRPGSPGTTENAPSPSKRPRLEGPSNFPNQQAMMRGPQQGQPVGTGPNNAAMAKTMLMTNNVDVNKLTQQQLSNFMTQASPVQAKSLSTYTQTLNQHHGAQMPNKQMGANPGGPQGQGSPMMPQGGDLNAYYPANMGGPEGMRAPGGPAAPGGSNHALQDYQMQLMLLEQQNKKRLMMARQEQNDITNRPDGPGGPGGPNAAAAQGMGQAGPNGPAGFQESPQGQRTGASPNPTDMKRGTPQMANANIPSPLPEGAQSRGSPNGMGFIANVDPNQGQHFFNGVANNGNQMNGAMRPPSSHPGVPNFNGQQLTPQQMLAQRGQPQGQGQPGVQGGPNMQWQQAGPNGNQVMPQGAQGPQGAPQGAQPVQNTPQQRNMPPPAPPAAGNNANARNTTASPQQNTQPPTPQQSNKAAPKKKESKNAKDKRTAASKKAMSNANAPPAAPTTENPPETTETPATPITPVGPNFPKGNQPAAAPQPLPNGAGVSAAPGPQPPAPVAQPPQPPPQDTAQNGFSMPDSSMDMSPFEFANPMQTNDVLQDFDFDSFLHDGDNGEGTFDFSAASFMDGGEISAE